MRFFRRVRGDERGLALVVALVVMVMISVLIVGAFSGAMMVVRSANLDYRNSRVFYASEAGAEAIMAQIADFLDDGNLTDAELAALTTPTIGGFTFGNLRVDKVGGIEIETVTDGPFAGLYSLTQRVDIFSEARDANDNFSGIAVSAKAQAIPIFQFGIFFEEDLEILPGPGMHFDGWVHTNGNLYVNSSSMNFHDVITTPNKVYWDRKDSHDRDNGVDIDDATSTAVQLDFDSRSHPNPNDFKGKSDSRFDGRLKSDAYQVDSLQVPLPNGVLPIAVMQPRDPADDAVTKQAKFAWKADWYLEVDVPAVTQSGSNQLCNNVTHTRPLPLQEPSKPECQTFFSMTYDAFYEGREGRYADVFQINVGVLGDWVLAQPNRGVAILYIDFDGVPTPSAQTDPRGDGFFPVVRLVNGSQIKSGALAVATERPFYIQGNYNTVNWVPAAVVGDAITWLSNAWTDAAHQGAGLTTASNTTINTAILAGHSATPCDHEVVGSNCPYGGGVENYPRFLEKWSGRTMTYNGSLVSLSQSVFATRQWAYGGYYTAPVRDWAFDMRFEDPTQLPPGTPVVGNVIRTAFRPVY